MKREPVTPEHERDQWLGLLLRRRPATPPTAVASDTCLDAETLAAWADGALNAKELAAAQVHVSNCSRCMTLLAALERTGPAMPAPEPSRAVVIRWLVPLTAAAAAVAIWIAIPEQRVVPIADEAASTSSQMPPAAEAPRVPPPAEGLPKVEPQPAQRARADSLSAQRRDEANEERTKRAAGATAENVAVPRSVPAAPEAQAPQASVGRSSDSVAAYAQREALNKVAVLDTATSDPMIRWRVTAGTLLERSTDGGKTWAKTSSSPGAAPNDSPAITIVAISAVDALNATVTTSDGRTLSTIDGGATWAPVQEKPAAPF